MRKISDFKNEEALDLLVRIIDPAVALMSDKEAVQKLYQKGQQLEGVKDLIKNHKKEVIELLAAIEDVPADEYEFNALMVPIRLLEILNDKELVAFFTAQQNLSSNGSSGDHTANTGAAAD